MKGRPEDGATCGAKPTIEAEIFGAALLYYNYISS